MDMEIELAPLSPAEQEQLELEESPPPRPAIAIVNEFPFTRPKKLPLIQRIRLFLYNPADHTILTRTALGWRNMSIFYLSFYVGLAAVFTICCHAMIYTLDDTQPKWKTANSLIGTSPGVTFRPEAELDDYVYLYDLSDAGAIADFRRSLDTFFGGRYTAGNGRQGMNCTYRRPARYNRVCRFNITALLGVCGPKHDYQLTGRTPCLFVKVNRVFGWMPQYYNNTHDLPSAMPASLKKHIARLPPSVSRNQIWISCGSADVDGIAKKRQPKGMFKYYPGRGLAGYYYPYLNLPGYVSPVVAVRVRLPTNVTSVLVECRAWAKNIKYRPGKRLREGSFVVSIKIADEYY